MIVYLHGFMSGPGSHKAMQFRDYMRRQAREHEYACPKLPPYTGQAIRQLEDWLATLAVSGVERVEIVRGASADEVML